MSTWHQEKARPYTLYHRHLWTLVTDPPHSFLSILRFDNEGEALQRLREFEALRDSDDPGKRLIGRYTYLLPPGGL